MNHSIRCTEFNHIVANKNITLYSNNTIAIPQQYYGREYLQILETENGIEYRNKRDVLKPNFQIKMMVTPNPANDILRVFVSPKSEYVNLNICIQALDGKVVNVTNILPGENIKEIDVRKLIGGVYSLLLKDGNKILDVQKLIVY